MQLYTTAVLCAVDLIVFMCSTPSYISLDTVLSGIDIVRKISNPDLVLEIEFHGKRKEIFNNK